MQVQFGQAGEQSELHRQLSNLVIVDLEAVEVEEPFKFGRQLLYHVV